MTKTILVLAANPKNTPPLRLDQEVREIDTGLERAQKRDEFALKQKLAARPVDVRRAMLDYKPNIVHFCGHGSGEEGIAFEDGNGRAKLVNTDALTGFFELFADKVECVVLNACYSEVQAEAMAKYIPYVIGMKSAIGDAAAIEFAVAFYDALGAGESFEFAYKLACNALQWAGISEHLIPSLKIRPRSTKHPDEEPPSLEKQKTSLHRDQTFASGTSDALFHLGNLFAMWTISGFLREDSEKYKYALSAFHSLLVAGGIKNPADTMLGWIAEAKKKASEAMSLPKTQFGFLEFDTSGPYESLEVEESYFRLWKLAVEAQETSNMAKVRLALSVSVGEERQKELVGNWNKRLK